MTDINDRNDPGKKDLDPLHLRARAGLPDDLRFLLEKYPREDWPGHKNLGEMARFWLDRHNMFRELCAALLQASAGLKDQEVKPAEFQGWFRPRYWFFLQQLQVHHQIEEVHYFPVMHRTEPKLTRGFSLLENDHEVIHHALVALQEAGIAFDRALATDPARILFAADDTARALEGFFGDLLRHLEDEEDLIMPVILDRGEDQIGLH